ncbi:hypothetical protein [Glycomyces buryatensis]|uniref:Uncharacterized protein n=1 Tax=Glycomyces buryatensis TaxID=2570927 RepID=A0A4S8PUS8_9ACTN|nr:hypothetical protein [Glycomyces buryatensis]THV33655.1 hypothetical protein FAB82_26335 [Glycomyces buryatensis]
MNDFFSAVTSWIALNPWLLGLLALSVVGFALRKRAKRLPGIEDKQRFTPSDWAILVCCLSVLPLWYFAIMALGPYGAGVDGGVTATGTASSVECDRAFFGGHVCSAEVEWHPGSGPSTEEVRVSRPFGAGTELQLVKSKTYERIWPTGYGRLPLGMLWAVALAVTAAIGLGRLTKLISFPLYQRATLRRGEPEEPRPEVDEVADDLRER